MSEATPVRISPNEFFLRKILVWMILEHPNAPEFFKANMNNPGVKELFFAIPAVDGSGVRCEWNRRTLSQVPTADLTTLFLVMEGSLGEPEAQAANSSIIT